MNSIHSITYSKKKLASGNYQVKFFVKGGAEEKYGYLLICGNQSEEEILGEIRRRIEYFYTSKSDLHRFSFTREFKDDHNFYLYSA
jgi:hypothetical protein